MNQKKSNVSRRQFLSSTALAGVSGALGGLTACSGGGGNENKYTPLHPLDEIYIPDLPDKAMDGKPITAALVGCGARGTGAAFNFLDAADHVSVVALAEMFPDKLNNCRNRLKESKGVEIPDNACFLGFDAYKKACDLPVDVILIASPSCFHPEHTRYAVEQGKHVFIEKPVAIDPVGYRTFMVTLKQARAKRLNVITGAAYHYHRPFVEAYRMIQAGYIGKILSGKVICNYPNEQFLKRQPEWSDTEYMIRTFFNWNCINGDQISNMLIHWIDVFVWLSHLKPVQVSAFGSRIRRTAGNVYDNFSMDFEFEQGVTVLGMVRRIDGCDNMEGTTIQGDKGVWRSRDSSIHDLEGHLVWKYDFEAAKAKFKTLDRFTLELIDLVNHIRQGKVIDIAEVTAISSMASIMARESAYSGKICTWDNMIASNLDLLPAEFASGQLGKMDMKKYETVPLPGLPVKDLS